MRKIQQRAGPLLGNKAQRGLRRIPLRVENYHGAPPPAKVLGDSGNQVAGLSRLDRPRDSRILLAQVHVDRDRAEGVTQCALAHGRPQDGRRRGSERHSCSRDGDGRVVDRWKLPQGRELRGGEDPLVERREWISLAALYATAVEPEQAVANRGPSLHQVVLCALRPKFGRDLLADAPRGGDNAEVHEEERAVLYIEPAAKLRVLDHRAVADHDVLPALAGDPRLVALISASRDPLEQDRRRRHRDLHIRRLAARRHHSHQPVDRRLALVLEVLEHLDPLDELRPLLQAEHRRRPS